MAHQKKSLATCPNEAPDRLNAEEVVEPILFGAQWAIRTVESLKRVCFVEIKEDRAARMSSAMDDLLGRVALTFAKGELVDAVRKEAENRLQQLEEMDPSCPTEIITDLRNAIFSDSRSVEVGIAARRLA